MKKTLIVVLSVLLVATTLFGAAVSEKSGPKEITEIKVMVYERGNEYPGGDSTVNNRLTRWMNSNLEKEGVRLVFVPIVRSGADNTVNSMLAAGNAPDVIMTYDKERVATYGSQGGLVDLAPYVNRLDRDWLKNAENALLQTQFEGKQYALPRVFEIYGRSHNQYIRKDLVEAMGMKVPTTRDELIKVLYAAKKAYPNITPYASAARSPMANIPTSSSPTPAGPMSGSTTSMSRPSPTSSSPVARKDCASSTASSLTGSSPATSPSMWMTPSTSRAWPMAPPSLCSTATAMRRCTPTQQSLATRCGRSIRLRTPMATT